MPNDSITPDLDVTRVMPASPDQIWSAWIDPTAIARWWGPDGFTSTVRELDVREGGRFDVVMQGPDGSTFENLYLFDTVEAGMRVTYVHQGAPEHGLAPSRSVVTIEEVDAGKRTSVTLRSFYASESDRKKHLVVFQAAAGAQQLLERLEQVAVGGTG
ncbi:SRPBCC domain-containing protein [Actinoplanes sp. NBRC 101535]|uniref:SRPBCC domain-containing protein n=1 Tax=Actinoplanes sp. NBRC 101535 TaxID=3032196 RepID=UPI0024A2B4EF|nr:SRPBCC domain-containing protein [Actinoplanes sp. NBRC 101535]GLY07841.1 activator of HSP90 ATPase [Actinoplanes sp. NBRC 101535]